MLDTRLIRMPEKIELHTKKNKDSAKYDVISFAGRPGSGKGYITKHLIETIMKDFNISNSSDIIISTGEIVSKYMNEEPEFKKSKEMATLAPTEILLPYVQREIINKRSILHSDVPVIFDGFPRNIEQLNIIDKSNINVAYICVEADEKICMERIGFRARDKYDSDQKNQIRRFEVFNQETQPMIEKLKKESRAFIIDNNIFGPQAVEAVLHFYKQLINKSLNRVTNNKENIIKR